MADHTHDDDLPSARSISSSHCEHGSVFIHLHGPGGEVIAQACMPVETAVAFIGDLTSSTEAALAARRVEPTVEGKPH